MAYFVGVIADTDKNVKVEKRVNQAVFLLTPEFRYLDVMNYLAPATCYEKWVKAYGCSLQKCWFSYDWFDSPEKLQ